MGNFMLDYSCGDYKRADLARLLWIVRNKINKERENDRSNVNYRDRALVDSYRGKYPKRKQRIKKERPY